MGRILPAIAAARLPSRARARQGPRRVATAASPAAANSARTAAPWLAPCSTTRAPAGSRWAGRRGRDGRERLEPVARLRPARAAARAQARRAPGRLRRRRADSRRSRRSARRASGAYQEPSKKRRLRSPRRAALRLATASAAALTSVAVTAASGRSAAIASAIAPLPVPRSSTAGRSMPAIAPSARSTSSSVSGRGTRTSGVTSSSSDQNSRRPVR